MVAYATAYDVNVEVRPADAGARLPIGTARRQHDTAFGQVAEQDATWIVRFGYAGVDGGRSPCAGRPCNGRSGASPSRRP